MSEFREITPECRANRGDYPAFDQATHDLWHVYGVMLSRHPEATFVLTLARKANAAPAASAAAPSAPADQTALRDRIRRAVCEAEGFAWDSDMLEPDEYGEVADTVLAVLPATVDRAAELSPAERTMLTYALNQAQLRMWATGKFTDEDQAAVVSLRRMADEAQQPAPWLSDSARIGRTLIWTWADIGKGVYGQGYRAAQAEARTLLTGQRDSDEAKQPETQAGCGCPNETAVEHQFGTADCTCIPFVREGGTARYCQPGDTVDQISGWERGGDCPHHRPPADEAQQADTAGEQQ